MLHTCVGPGIVGYYVPAHVCIDQTKKSSILHVQVPIMLIKYTYFDVTVMYNLKCRQSSFRYFGARSERAMNVPEMQW